MAASCFARVQPLASSSEREFCFLRVFSSLPEDTLPSSSSFTASIVIGACINSGHIHNPAWHTTIYFGDPTLVCNGQLYEEEKHLEEYAENSLLARRYLAFLLLSLFMSSLEIWLDVCSQRGGFQGCCNMMASKESPAMSDRDPFCSCTPAKGSLQNKPSPQRISC